MAEFKLTNVAVFPEGTKVGAYPASNWPTPYPPSGAPLGTAAATATMTGGAAVLTGLDLDSHYWAAAEVGGAWRYVYLFTGFVVTGMVDASEIAFPLDVTRAAAADDVITSKVTGDTQNRFVYNTDGKLEWGTGAVAPVVNLFYTGVSTELKTDGSFRAGNTIAGNHKADNQTEIGGVGPGGQSGIKLGGLGDTNLYRSAADTLKTDDDLVLAGNESSSKFIQFLGSVGSDVNDGKIGHNLFGNGLNIVGTRMPDTIRRIQIWGSVNQNENTAAGGNTFAGSSSFTGAVTAGQFVTSSNGLAAINLTAATGTPGITFGGDVNLYRGGINVLKTDDSIWANEEIRANGLRPNVAGNGFWDSGGNIEITAELNHDGAKVGFYGVAPATKPTALTAANAEVVDEIYGPEESNAIKNTRTRVNELETKLKALGLIA